jgi:putative endopeptidase
MDEKGIEKAGLTGVKPLLDKIAKVKDVKSLNAALVALQDAGLGPAFSGGGQPDFTDATKNVLWVDSSGLGLPDRDYYFQDQFKDKVTAYHDHLVKMFTIMGDKDADAQKAADDILGLEHAMADATMTLTERRDPKSQYNPYKLADLIKLTPNIDWKGYLKARGKAKLDFVVVAQPKYFQALDGLMGSAKPDVWREYLTYQVLEGFSFGLPKAYDDETFAFTKALYGVEEQQERWKRCVGAVGGNMPEALAVPYLAKMFPGESKQKATETVDAIAKAFDDNLSTVDWMSDATKTAARSKLGKIAHMIGYPDKPRAYTFKVSRKGFAANLLAGSTFESRRQFAKAGTPYDRNEWLMPAYIVNAYYNPSANNTALPAGILQPPFWGKDRSIAANEGGIGMVIGHELTHGFDDQGAQFDEEGNFKMWWQPADFEKFKQKGQCIADQYSTFKVGDHNVNGQLTLGEDIADNGGVKLAFHAYRTLRDGADKHYVADGLTEDQQFFLGVGQAWCSNIRPDFATSLLTTDVHAPDKWRVYGALVNDPDFAKAFRCKSGSKMRPAKTCSVW